MQSPPVCLIAQDYALIGNARWDAKELRQTFEDVTNDELLV